MIALQINNSNELRKAKAFEMEMLHEIRRDLILDTIYFNAVKARPMRVKNAADRLIKMKRDNDIVKDSVDYLFDKLGIGLILPTIKVPMNL